MKPERLGRKLRGDDGDAMRRRRTIVVLSLFNIVSMGAITLYQMGVVKHVPLEPPLPGFDADRVNGSTQAYEILQMPDAPLGLGSYAATLGLACIGEPERAQTKAWAPLLLAAKAGVDAILAGKLLMEQPKRYKAFSSWAIASACATFAIAALAVPEAYDAWQTIRHDHE
jgi:hypothetical protein